MSYIYRVVDKDGIPLKTNQSTSHGAFYSSLGTAKGVATRANNKNKPDRFGYLSPPDPNRVPFTVQRSLLEWEDVSEPS